MLPCSPNASLKKQAPKKERGRNNESEVGGDPLQPVPPQGGSASLLRGSGGSSGAEIRRRRGMGVWRAGRGRRRPAAGFPRRGGRRRRAGERVLHFSGRLRVSLTAPRSDRNVNVRLLCAR